MIEYLLFHPEFKSSPARILIIAKEFNGRTGSFLQFRTHCLVLMRNPWSSVLMSNHSWHEESYPKRESRKSVVIFYFIENNIQYAPQTLLSPSINSARYALKRNHIFSSAFSMTGITFSASSLNILPSFAKLHSPFWFMFSLEIWSFFSPSLYEKTPTVSCLFQN